jgi:carbon-monoxide dehydrogenase iron sulfur subunit
MEKYRIVVDTGKCTGCLRCQLACSDAHIKIFNPSEAKIQVVFSHMGYTINFLTECDECGICVDHCFYGALKKSEKRAVP